MFDVLFLCWAALVVAGLVLSAKGARQGNAEKQARGKRLLTVAAGSALLGVVLMIYVVAVSGVEG